MSSNTKPMSPRPQPEPSKGLEQPNPRRMPVLPRPVVLIIRLVSLSLLLFTLTITLLLILLPDSQSNLSVFTIRPTGARLATSSAQPLFSPNTSTGDGTTAIHKRGRGVGGGPNHVVVSDAWSASVWVGVMCESVWYDSAFEC